MSVDQALPRRRTTNSRIAPPTSSTPAMPSGRPMLAPVSARASSSTAAGVVVVGLVGTGGASEDDGGTVSEVVVSVVSLVGGVVSLLDGGVVSLVDDGGGVRQAATFRSSVPEYLS